MYIPKLRKIQQVVDMMRKQDKNTVITYNIIERLIKTKQISAVRFGVTWIVNLDKIYAFFTKDKGD